MTVDQQKLDSLVGRLFGDLSAGCGGVMVSLGDKLGLYRAMAGAGPLSGGSGEPQRLRRAIRTRVAQREVGRLCGLSPTSGTYEPRQAGAHPRRG
jgi:hypothetical protein